MKHVPAPLTRLAAKARFASAVPTAPASDRAREAIIAALTAARPGRVSPAIVLRLVQAGDALIIAACGIALYWLYVRPDGVPVSPYYLAMILGAALAVPIALQMTGSYTIAMLTRGYNQGLRLAATLSAVFMMLMAGVFFLKAGEDYSRVWLSGWFLLSLTTLLAARLGLAGAIRRWQRRGQLTRRVVIVGGGEEAQTIIGALNASAGSEVQIVGLFDDRTDERSPGEVEGCLKLGTTAELAEFARRVDVDMLLVTLPVTAERRLLQVLKALWVLPVDIRLSAYAQKLRYRPRAYSWLGTVPLLDVFDKPLRDWDLVAKAVEDKVLSAIALLLLSPVMALVALAIKLDSRGPVFFRQRRYGFNNELIEVYKFRSMHADRCDADARTLVTRSDPRVTRVGRFIRKTSLDELPQLINVLRGELSLVGPRPHATHAKASNRLYDEVVEGYFARHKVKPGITGWAQVNGWRGETDTEEKIRRRVEHDLYYIENWSVLFDLYILAKTPFALLAHDTAY